jgi:hypothetical protein
MQTVRLAGGWCWFVLKEKYCRLVADDWFVMRENYCWLMADKPSEHGAHYLKIMDRRPVSKFMKPGIQILEVVRVCQLDQINL